jgi:hypothetical protein
MRRKIQIGKIIPENFFDFLFNGDPEKFASFYELAEIIKSKFSFSMNEALHVSYFIILEVAMYLKRENGQTIGPDTIESIQFSPIIISRIILELLQDIPIYTKEEEEQILEEVAKLIGSQGNELFQALTGLDKDKTGFIPESSLFTALDSINL